MNVVDMAETRGRWRMVRRLATLAVLLCLAVVAAKGGVSISKLSELWTILPLKAATNQGGSLKSGLSEDVGLDGASMFLALEARAGLGPKGVTASAGDQKKRYPHRDVLCLARGIYHDGEKLGPEARKAIALVAYNRLESGDFGTSMCRVVYRGMGSQFGCLYREACKAIADVPTDLKRWESSIALAVQVLRREATNDALEKATHFYSAAGRAPRWSRRVKQIAEIEGIVVATEMPLTKAEAKKAAETHKNGAARNARQSAKTASRD